MPAKSTPDTTETAQTEPAQTSDKRWWQLVRSGSLVGYRRRLGRAELFSRDGYAWSGAEIPYDHAQPETGLRDAGARRVFHGDVVSMRTSADDPEWVERVVLLDKQGQILMGQPGSARLTSARALWPSGARPPVAQRVGSVFRDRYFRLAYDGSLRSLEMASFSGWPLALRAAVAINLGLVMTASVQLALSANVDPLITVGGSALVLGFEFLRLSRQMPLALRRARLLASAPRAGLLVAMTLALAYGSAALIGSPGLPRQAGPALIGSGAAFLLGFLLAFALTATVGNLVHHYRQPRRSADAAPSS